MSYVANMAASASASAMTYYSEEEYDNYDNEYEEYTGSGKCKKFINNTSAVKPVAKKPIVRVKPVKNSKPKMEKPVVTIVKEERKEVEVVDCWEDLL